MPKIVAVGEAYGAYEEQAGRPLVGVSGIEFFSQLVDAGLIKETPLDRENKKDFWYFWRLWRDNGRSSRFINAKPMERIWVAHPEIYLTNVFNLRPDGNSIEHLTTNGKEGVQGLPAIKAGKYLKRELEGELRRLQAELETICPNLIICLGGIATWAILRDSRITKLRGAITAAVPPFKGKVLPIYHPAHIIRPEGYKNRPATIMDLMKGKHECEFPEIRRPKRTLLVPESIMDLYEIQKIPHVKGISPDIETEGDIITCVGFAFSENLACTIPFFDPRKSDGCYWRTLAEERLAWDTVRILAGRNCPKVFQNCLFDINRLWRGYGITFKGEIEDTMLMFHAQMPESQKDLGFLGSIGTNEPAWKLMRSRKRDGLKREE